MKSNLYKYEKFNLRQNTGDDLSSNSSKKSNDEDSSLAKQPNLINRLNRTSYLNNQLNSKRIPLVKTKSSSELAEQTNNLRRLREENNLKNLIKKS